MPDHSVYDCDSSNECSSCGLVFCDHYVHPDDDSSTCGWSEEDWHAFAM